MDFSLCLVYSFPYFHYVWFNLNYFIWELYSWQKCSTPSHGFLVFSFVLSIEWNLFIFFFCQGYVSSLQLICWPVCSQDVFDRVNYLSSLGKTQTAAVRRDADIGVAEAERDAGIRVRMVQRLRGWFTCFSCILIIPAISASVHRKQNVRKRWWMWNLWRTSGWPTPNESWSCRNLHSTKKLTLRWEHKLSHAVWRCRSESSVNAWQHFISVSILE